jgi:hypothetical protein
MTVVLALLAVMVPAVVALVGYWFKDQSDKHLKQEHQDSETRLKQEHEQSETRLKQEDEQEGARLRLDAAMRAADLFGPSDNAPASAARPASGLLALTRLEFADLAVALLVDLWSPNGGPPLPADGVAHASFGVPTEIAIQVIDAALRCGDPEAQLMAAELLCRHADTLEILNSLHWPSSVTDTWIQNLPVTAKLLIVDALVHMALASKETKNALRELAVRLYSISIGDQEERVQGCIGMLMQAIMPKVRHLGYTDFMRGGAGIEYVTLHDMEVAAAKASHHPDGYFETIVQDRSKKLADWAKKCTELSCTPGTLAATV